MQSGKTFVIVSSRAQVIFSNICHQIHQKGRDFNLIWSGLMVAFLALTRGQWTVSWLSQPWRIDNLFPIWGDDSSSAETRGLPIRNGMSFLQIEYFWYVVQYPSYILRTSKALSIQFFEKPYFGYTVCIVTLFNGLFIFGGQNCVLYNRKPVYCRVEILKFVPSSVPSPFPMVAGITPKTYNNVNNEMFYQIDPISNLFKMFKVHVPYVSVVILKSCICRARENTKPLQRPSET